MCIFAASNIKNYIMNTITIQVEDRSVMSGLKKVLQSMNGVVVLPAKPKRKTGIEKGLEDIRKGNVYHAKNSDDLIKQILG